MKNNARYAIGMTVCMMRGQIENYKDHNYWGNLCDRYYIIQSILDDWKIHKRYWSTKKEYVFCNKDTMFGVTKGDIVDDWLWAGFKAEKKLKKILKELEPMARH